MIPYLTCAYMGPGGGAPAFEQSVDEITLAELPSGLDGFRDEAGVKLA